MSTVQECMELMEQWIQEDGEKTVLSHEFMIGIIRTLVHEPAPAQMVVQEIRSYLSAFDHLRGKRAASPGPAA